uniref:Uncharacterized protein n=1 Tax=Avena sativa TaxID=4498 RepID=A0ACD5U534_AVESA
MQQQQQPQGGGGGGGPAQQFGLHPPEMPPFSPPGSAAQQRISMPEGPSPISSRPPAPPPVQQQQQQLSNDLASAGAVGFDEEALAAAAAGEEGASGGAGGNRWPRQETLALLKIRSDMDAAFRDAALKGPLWEEVSRKLAEEGYRRNAKKCKEKFENVHKYYKRTKDSRAGRNDGKTYRFFQQLEALHGTPGAASPVAPPATAVGVPGVVGPSAVRPLAEPPPVAATAGMATPVVGGNLSFSTSNTEDCSDEDSDDEGTDDMGERGKRKRSSEGDAPAAAGSGKMMKFFEGLMKQVMERQEAMQQRFLEAIEKREQDRMIREEAWRRQEMARLAREQEILAQERAMAATRDAAVLSFIQKITGQTIPMPSIAAPAITFMPPPPPSSSQNHATPIAFSVAPPPSSQIPATASTHSQRQPSPRPQKPPTMPPAAPQPLKSPAPATPQPPPPQQALVVHQSSTDIVMTPAETPPDASGYDGSGGGSGAASSSRWPKAEVHALIQLRSNLDMRYQEAGPKGPLWEEISAGMRRMGYSRSSKRCKEKWENINKYFKKVKESNKKRPEDSKTCPYFHQLEALYRNKAALGSPSGAGGAAALPLPAAEHANAAPQDRIEAFTIAAPISQTAPQPHTLPAVAKNGVTNNDGNGHGVGGASGGTQMHASNGGSVAANRFVFSEASGRAATKKPEDIMKETTMRPQPQPQPQVSQQATINSYSRTGGGGAADSDNMDDEEEDEDDYDEEEEDEDDLDGNKMQYEMFQRQQHQHQHQHHNVVRANTGATSGGGNPPGTTAPSAAPAATTTAGSFLGMVQ